ncbi:MAG TPA: hypothetical protein VLD19_17910, partial [Chitinophagaceae bacterium]|nr:hypothetical protein [Chitinophagaceae bacterium]
MKLFTISRFIVMAMAAVAPHRQLWAQEPANGLKTDNTASFDYRPQLLQAFSHFPELTHTAIQIRIKHAYSPLSTRPRWSTIFRSRDKRAYIITISDSSVSKLAPILFMRLTYEAQVGVLGHELSHVADFSHKRLFGLIRIGVGHLSGRYLDRFEYKTDSLCIEHGLGNYLLAWSIFVREALQLAYWRGADSINRPVIARER